MPRWKDAEKQIPELSGQRKARETKLFEDHQPLKFAPFSNICSKEDEKTVLTHFFSSNYGLLELGDKEARNMFLTWCLGAKDMTPEEVRNMTVESAAEKFNEFKEDIAKHPIFGDEAKNHTAWYGEIYGKAYAHIKDIKYPTPDEVSNPEKLAEIKSSDIYFMGYLAQMYPGTVPSSLKESKEFNNAFDKHISQNNLAKVCDTLGSYIYMVSNATNMEIPSTKRMMYKVMLESDIAPLIGGKNVTETFKVGNSYINKYMDKVLDGLDSIDYNKVHDEFHVYDIETLNDNAFSKVKETEPFIADKMKRQIRENIPASVTFRKETVFNEYYKGEAELKWEEEIDDFERKCDNAEKQIILNEREDIRSHRAKNAEIADSYRKEIYDLGESMSDCGEKVKNFSIADKKYTDLPLRVFLNTILMDKELLKETAESFDTLFSDLLKSQDKLFKDKYFVNNSGKFSYNFRAYSKDGNGRDVLMRISDEASGFTVGLSNEQIDQIEKATILYYMAKDDFRVDYRPLVYRNDGTIYRTDKSFPVSNGDLVNVKLPTDEEVKSREEYSIKSAEDADNNSMKQNNEYYQNRENVRIGNIQRRAEKRASLDRTYLIFVNDKEYTKETFLKKAYENGWNEAEDGAFLNALVDYRIKELKDSNGSNKVQQEVISAIVNQKLSEKNHYLDREKILNTISKGPSNQTLSEETSKAIKYGVSKKKLESLETNRSKYENDLTEENPNIRNFLIASYAACFNKDGSIDETLEKMRDGLYKSKNGLQGRLKAYSERIMAIPAENRSAEQEKSYQAALKYNEYQAEKDRDWDFPKRMSSLGWYSKSPANSVYRYIISRKNRVENKEEYNKLLDAFEKGEHIDNPGVKLNDSPDPGKLTIDMMNRAYNLLSEGEQEKGDKNDLKKMAENIAETRFYTIALPLEKRVKALKNADLEAWGRKADEKLEGLPENASDEYKDALSAIKAFAQKTDVLEGRIQYNYSFYDNNCKFKDDFFEKFKELDEKLGTYIASVNGEDPDMLAIWAKFNPEKAAMYADKMPAPRKEEAKEEVKEDVKDNNIINEQQKDVIVNNDNKEIIIENNEKNEQIIDNNEKNEKNEQIFENNEIKTDANIIENDNIIEEDIIEAGDNDLDEFEVIEAPQKELPDEETMTAEKEKLMTIKANLDRVVRAYAGHTNTPEYNRMLGKLDLLLGENDPAKYAEYKDELGEESRKYLDHTGLKKAKHPNSEVRRKCAFLLMAYTDHPLFGNYIKLANQKRAEEDQVSLNSLKNMPGVGAPAPVDRTRISIKDLADEQQAEDGIKTKKTDRLSIHTSSLKKESNISLDEDVKGDKKKDEPQLKLNNH